MPPTSGEPTRQTESDTAQELSAEQELINYLGQKKSELQRQPLLAKVKDLLKKERRRT
jgi:hypothetical protein